MTATEDRIQGRPLYEYSAVGRMLDIERRSITRWFEGYEVTRKGIRIVYPPWLPHPEGGLLSFADLMELWFVHQFQKHRVRLETIRSTYRLMSEELKTPRPFLKKTQWLVVGQRILNVDIAHDPDATIVSDPCSCQLYLNQIALEVGDKIEFDEQDFACQWFPLGKAKPIVVDPTIGYGQPTIKGHRLGTRDVFALWKAEDQDVGLVCEAYDITPEEVEAAVAWESSKI